MSDWEVLDPSTGTWSDFNPEKWEKLADRTTNLARTGVSYSVDKALTAAGKDPNVDYMTGVPDIGFRGHLAERDTKEEQEAYLNQTLGKKGEAWTVDPSGAYIANPLGLAQLGIVADRPRAIDEDRWSLADFADWQGEILPVGGSMIGGAAGSSLGPLGAVFGAMIGGMGGKGIQETKEALTGANLEGPMSVATGIGRTGTESALGEGLYQGILRPLGKFFMAPYANKVDPAAVSAMKEAEAMGVQPSFNQVVNAPIVGRTSRIAERVLGDPLTGRNAEALRRQVDLFLESLSPNPTKLSTQVGERIIGDIKGARKTFSEKMREAYRPIVEIFGTDPIVPTQRIKEAASSIYGNLPKTKDGTPVFSDPETVRYLENVSSLPDFVPFEEARAMRTFLFNAIGDPGLAPKVETRYLRKLHEGVGRALEQTGDILPPGAAVDPAQLAHGKKLLGMVNRTYRAGIQKFDDDLLERIVRDPGKAGSIDPELIVDSVFRKGRPSQIQRVMRILPETTRGEARRYAFEKILDGMTRPTENPFINLLDGSKLTKELKAYGNEALEAMFGKDAISTMHKLARVTSLIGRKQKDQGGLVAATIAARPLQNLGRIAQLKAVSAVFKHPDGLKWLTTGLEAPNAREGAEALTRFLTLLNAQIEEAQAEVEVAP